MLTIVLIAAVTVLAVAIATERIDTVAAASAALLLALGLLVAERWSRPRPGDRVSTGLAATIDGYRAGGSLTRNVAAIVVELRGIAADTLVDGPSAWSEPIAVVARRMAAADLGDGFALARLGPHTFGAVVLVDDRGAAVAAAESLVALCRVPVPTPARDLRIDAVAGVSHATVGERCTGEELLRAADASLRVDGAVASPVASADSRLLRHARRVIEVETEIRHSLDVDLLTAKLVPVVDVRADEIVGFRSAYDWTAVSATDPDHLGSIAAALGLRRSIETQYLMRSIGAAEDLPVDPHRRVVAEVDASRITDERFVSQIVLLLQASGIDPTHFVLEFASWGAGVLEPVAVDTLRELGVGIGLRLRHHRTWETVPEALVGRLDTVSVRAGDLVDDDRGTISPVRIDQMGTLVEEELRRVTVIGVDDASTALELSANGLSVQCGAVHGRPMAAVDLNAWLLGRSGG